MIRMTTANKHPNKAKAIAIHRAIRDAMKTDMPKPIQLPYIHVPVNGRFHHADLFPMTRRRFTLIFPSFQRRGGLVSEFQDRLIIAFAASNTVCPVGTVTSSNGGENGIGTCIAPIRFTGASKS